MGTITSHIFVNMFQMVYFSAAEFTRGNEKNMSFSSGTKISESFKKI